jgi:hypothetical protein
MLSNSGDGKADFDESATKLRLYPSFPIRAIAASHYSSFLRVIQTWPIFEVEKLKSQMSITLIVIVIIHKPLNM